MALVIPRYQYHLKVPHKKNKQSERKEKLNKPHPPTPTNTKTHKHLDTYTPEKAHTHCAKSTHTPMYIKRLTHSHRLLRRRHGLKLSSKVRKRLPLEATNTERSDGPCLQGALLPGPPQPMQTRGPTPRCRALSDQSGPRDNNPNGLTKDSSEELKQKNKKNFAKS